MSSDLPSNPMSARWELPTVDQLQGLLPSCEILALLGRGGMGAVYKGRQKSLNRLVAIKILPAWFGDDEWKFAERFKHESQTIAQLGHPAIIHVYDFGETTGALLYFVMEYVDGRDVAALLATEGRLAVEQAVGITKVVCEALHYAHSHGVIHRDIKPANVLINREGRVKVADFGLAKMSDPAQASGLTRTNVAIGTQEFAAPEMLTPGATVDHRADLYSLGVMLYQMLTGEIPRVLFKLPSRSRPELGMRFDALICKALETDPADRFQSALEFRDALAAAADAVISAPAAPVVRRASNKLPWAVAAGLMALAGGGWYFGHGDKPMAAAPSPVVKSNEATGVASDIDLHPWTKLLDTPEAVTRSGIKNLELKDGWLTVMSERLYLVWLAGGKDKVRDMAFRATVRPPTNEWPIAAVLHAGADPQYFLDVHHDRLTLRRVKQVASSKRDYTELGNVPLDLRQAKDGAFQLEASIQGNLITIMADGAKIMEVRDEGAARAGDIALVAPSESKGSGKIKDLAFRLLDESAVATKAQGRTIDLLPLIDVFRDTITGSWKLENSLLATNKAGGQNFIRFSAAPAGEYDLHVRLRREETDGATLVHFAVTHAGHGANVIIDGVPNPRIGLEHVGGKSMSQNGVGGLRAAPFFAPGRMHEVVIEVRDSGIVVDVNHDEALRWSGAWTELSQQGSWFARVQDGKPVLGIGAVGVPVVIESIQVREIPEEDPH